MHHDDHAVIPAPFGHVAVTLVDGAVVDVSLAAAAARPRAARSAAGKRVVARLKSYLRNPARSLKVPLALAGTAHQQRVWRALQRIPVGRVLSYGELARRLKSSPRAIGGACRANPVALIVPCHRVVSANGRGGFMGRTRGAALRIKDWLLTHEGAR
jgi:methylated-DNA-[protein]-cysteine S-methyltransferase